MKDSTMIKGGFWLGIIGAVTGLLGCVFGALSYFGLGPDVMRDTLGGWYHVLFPVSMAMFGFLFGFSVRHIAARRKLQAVEAERDESIAKAASETEGLSTMLDIYKRNLAERDEEIAALKEKYDDLLSEREREQGVGEIPPDYIKALFDGDIELSPNAKNVWSRADARERASFRMVCAASAFDSGNGHAVTPLILELDGTLSEIGLDESEIETLIEIGLVKKTENGRRLYIAKEIDDGFVADGVRCDEDSVTFQLSNGTFRTGLVSGRSVGGTFASLWTDCVDLGIIEFTSAGVEVASKLSIESNGGIYEYLKAHHQGRKQAIDFSRSKKRS